MAGQAAVGNNTGAVKAAINAVEDSAPNKGSNIMAMSGDQSTTMSGITTEGFHPRNKQGGALQVKESCKAEHAR